MDVTCSTLASVKRVSYFFFCLESLSSPSRVFLFFLEYLFASYLAILSLSQPMQGSDFDDEEFDVGTLRYHHSNAFRPQLGIEEDTFSDYSVDPPAPRRPLRSRPPIDFSSSSQYSTYDYPPSLTLGSTCSTAYSDSNEETFSFVPKAASSIGRSSGLSIKAIAALTVIELGHNPHYCELRDSHDYLSRVLARYLGKDLQVGEPCSSRAAKSRPLAPDIYRGVFY